LNFLFASGLEDRKQKTTALRARTNPILYLFAIPLILAQYQDSLIKALHEAHRAYLLPSLSTAGDKINFLCVLPPGRRPYGPEAESSVRNIFNTNPLL
jgi:hypothetical protein